MWEVYARESPSSDLVQIGSIEIVDSFVPNDWADENLFFRHQNYNEDIKLVEEGALRREWRDAVFRLTWDTWSEAGMTASDLPTGRE